jgi:hypothetical protein
MRNFTSYVILGLGLLTSRGGFVRQSVNTGSGAVSVEAPVLSRFLIYAT